MGPRPPGLARPAEGGDLYAHKCDLCRGIGSGPQCVTACPTQAIFRLEPAAEIGELSFLFGKPAKGEQDRAGRAPLWQGLLGAAIADAALVTNGAVMHARDLLSTGVGLGDAAA